HLGKDWVDKGRIGWRLQIADYFTVCVMNWEPAPFFFFLELRVILVISPVEPATEFWHKGRKPQFARAPFGFVPIEVFWDMHRIEDEAWQPRKWLFEDYHFINQWGPMGDVPGLLGISIPNVTERGQQIA